MISMTDETLLAIVETTKRFAGRELSKNIAERDKYPEAHFAADIHRVALEVGLTGLCAPECACGVNMPPESLAPILECAAAADPGIACSILAHNMAAFALGGDEKLWERLASPAEGNPWAYPVYLDAYDTDGVLAARREGGSIILDGEIKMAANAPISPIAVLPAKINDRFVPIPVDLSLNGVKVGKPLHTLGMHSCPAADIALDGCRISSDCLPENAQTIKNIHFNFYPAAAGISLGILEASLRFAISYGKERYQGGKMISDHLQIRAMYARMEMEVRAARQAAFRSGENDDNLFDRISAKCIAAETSVRGTTDGVQLIGGYGYTREYPQEQRMRDARQAAELLGSPRRLRLSMIDLAML